MSIVSNRFARLIDLSAVQANHSEGDVREVAAYALQQEIIAVHVLPCWVPLLRSLLPKGGSTLVGAPIGFPGGAHVTDIKVAEAVRLVADGAEEVDMVINIAKVLSGDFAGVAADIAAVVGAVAPTPVKVILECHYLDEALIRRCCDLAIASGAVWIKTATGWAASGATAANVAIISDQVRGRVGIKAAGGVRTLDDVRDFYRKGVRRFGISLSTTRNLLTRLNESPELFPELADVTAV
ncbi:MAG: deoxyribose-phosphate aldolase [Ancalomicrobiaceae bacterium]|nr:deoxyribose-phosphate aldolase [Ancalomicrobiaceae bacterium]